MSVTLHVEDHLRHPLVFFFIEGLKSMGTECSVDSVRTRLAGRPDRPPAEDVITEVDGQPLQGESALAQAINAHQVGETSGVSGAGFG
jgi:hypothetical protein